jgi:hypothetical protein
LVSILGLTPADDGRWLLNGCQGCASMEIIA